MAALFNFCQVIERHLVVLAFFDGLPACHFSENLAACAHPEPQPLRPHSTAQRIAVQSHVRALLASHGNSVCKIASRTAALFTLTSYLASFALCSVGSSGQDKPCSFGHNGEEVRSERVQKQHRQEELTWCISFWDFLCGCVLLISLVLRCGAVAQRTKARRR